MRSRNLKPSIFDNEELARLGSNHVVLFEALWCMADRDGRLEDRPGQIQAKAFPFRFQRVNVEKMLRSLAASSEQFITRYEFDGKRYLQINQFLKHQYPHLREKPSTIPAPVKHSAQHSAKTIQAHLNPESCILNPVTPLPPQVGDTAVRKGLRGSGGSPRELRKAAEKASADAVAKAALAKVHYETADNDVVDEATIASGKNAAPR